MRIGELSSAAGVPTKTIRYYERIGVLAAPRRTASGYRAYDPPAVDRLRFIRAAQAVGLTLGEIRSIVALRDRGETPCAHVMDLINTRAAELDQRINELQRLRADLERLARRARRLDPDDCDPNRICHLIGPDAIGDSQSTAGGRSCDAGSASDQS
jgi:DNA-binding transcriptional MerR regulator